MQPLDCACSAAKDRNSHTFYGPVAHGVPPRLQTLVLEYSRRHAHALPPGLPSLSIQLLLDAAAEAVAGLRGLAVTLPLGD